MFLSVLCLINHNAQRMPDSTAAGYSVLAVLCLINHNAQYIPDSTAAGYGVSLYSLLG